MNCQTVQHSLWAHLDGQLPEKDTRSVLLHLAGCRDCLLLSQQFSRLRGALRELPAHQPPEELTVNLRVMASREIQRRSHRLAPWAAFVAWLSTWAEPLTRPVALHFAGGFVSAMLLFAMLAPNFVLARTGKTDVPISLFTQAAVKYGMPFGFNDDDFIIEVVVDGRGQMVDYYIARGPSLVKNPELRRSIENYLLFSTEFEPATAFGAPTYGRIFVTFNRDHVNVKS